MASPAGPNLTTEDYRLIYELLVLNPTAANEGTRVEIEAFFNAQTMWRADAINKRTGTPW